MGDFLIDGTQIYASTTSEMGNPRARFATATYLEWFFPTLSAQVKRLTDKTDLVKNKTLQVDSAIPQTVSRASLKYLDRHLIRLASLKAALLDISHLNLVTLGTMRNTNLEALLDRLFSEMQIEFKSVADILNSLRIEPDYRSDYIRAIAQGLGDIAEDHVLFKRLIQAQIDDYWNPKTNKPRTEVSYFLKWIRSQRSPTTALTLFANFLGFRFFDFTSQLHQFWEGLKTLSPDSLYKVPPLLMLVAFTASNAVEVHQRFKDLPEKLKIQIQMHNEFCSRSLELFK